jgi:hypothetical protein
VDEYTLGQLVDQQTASSILTNHWETASLEFGGHLIFFVHVFLEHSGSLKMTSRKSVQQV